MFHDKELTCQACRRPFTFTAGEQGYYVDQGFLHEPSRCSHCREERRRLKNRSRAVTILPCAACGTRAEVPFVPKEGRPVYCDACYEQEQVAATATVATR